MEETVLRFPISELIRRRQPITAISALDHSHFSSSSSSSTSKSKSPPPHGPAIYSNPSHNKILSPLSHPFVLIGTLTLPTELQKCTNCFKFSDSSSTICCDVLDFSVRMIGKQIHVLSWNFIPFKHSQDGFLEIIKYNIPDSTNNVAFSSSSIIDSISLVSGRPSSPTKEDNLKAGYSFHGPIQSISPVSVVPCSLDANKSKNLRGFIAQIRICECIVCNSKEPSEQQQQQQHSHSFTKLLFVYFYDSFSSWYPVITKLVRKFVTISALKKKLVFIGKDNPELMFLITKNSVIHVPRVAKDWSPILRNVMLGKGECGDYKGVVSGVHMQGMVVELDKEVWLLLTDQLLVVPHSLRVGAIVSLRNVHFVNPKFAWTKMLILGACFKTSITVDSFSPLETGCHMVSHSQSQLGKFIKSLNFSARMWALLVISSFRKKFAATLSEIDILGSKHTHAHFVWMAARCNQKEGLAYTFTSSHLPSSVIRPQLGMFMEACKHDALGCGYESYCANLKLVPAISTFLHHCEVSWMKVLVQLESSCHFLPDNCQSGHFSCKGRSYGRPLRRVFQSEDIGVSLLGSLKISPSSGRLQLVDSTGSIDVLIPDLPSTWKSNDIYEVVNYSLIMEGTPDLVDHSKFPGNDSFSCRHIFHCTPWTRKINLTVYIYFRLSNATCKNLPFYPSVGWNYECKELKGGKFHMIWITHKYPVLRKFQEGHLVSDKATMFAEAIILPWDFYLLGNDGTVHPVKVSGDRRNEPSLDYQEYPPNKKLKIDQASGHAFASGSMNDSCQLRTCSGSLKGCTELNYGHLCSPEIPCLVTVRVGNIHNFIGSGKLCCMKCKMDTSDDNKPRTEKVLLEFNSENFFKYELLQIGSYYIIKHHAEESFCSITDKNYVSGVKVFISSGIHMWSVSFSSNEVVTNNRSSDDPSQDNSSFGSRESMKSDQDETFLKVTDNSRESCSDVLLSLDASAMHFLQLNLKATKAHFEPPMALEETFSVPSDVSTTIASSSFPTGSLCYSSFLPEGNLTSVHGYVVTFHGFGRNSSDVCLNRETLGALDMRHFQGNTSSYCIQALVDNQMVTISGSLSKHVIPVGFGPNVNATFHRILKLRGTNQLRLTSVSFIVLNSIKVADGSFIDLLSKVHPKFDIAPASTLEKISSGIISELIHYRGCKSLQLTCRVVAVHVLVLEKNKKYHDLALHSRQDIVDIPLVGLVLDDGSSTCCCWANGENATMLLRLHEKLPSGAFESSGCAFKWVGIEKNCWKNTMFHLERIIRKHERVAVRNHGSTIESSYQDFTVSVHSNNALSSTDENLLKSIVFNACYGTSLTVVASVMDSDSVKQLEKEHLMQVEMAVLAMHHVWAMEVQLINTISESRNMIQELLDR